MNKKYWLLLILVIVLGQFVFADDDLEKQYELLEELDDLLENLDEEHQDYSDQINQAIKDIRALEGNIRNTEAEIIVLDGKIDDNKGMIAVASIELEAAKVALNNTNELLNERIRVMYKNGSVGYFEVLLESKNFEDLLVRVDMLQRIVHSDTDLILQMEEDQRNVEVKKADLETEQENLIALQNEMDAQRKKLENQVLIVAKEKELNEKNQAYVEVQIDEINEDANKISEYIKEIESREQFVGGSMSWPTPENKQITSFFGMRLHPILGVNKMHTGIDISANTGSSVLSALEGTVIWSNWLGSYGKCVMVDHGGGITTVYAHLSTFEVSKGDQVNQNQLLARSGNTGNSTGPHLHFEVRVDGEYVDPLDGWVGAAGQ